MTLSIVTQAMKSEVGMLWRRKRSQVEMMSDRGYKISKAEKKAIRSRESFEKYVQPEGEGEGEGGKVAAEAEEEGRKALNKLSMGYKGEGKPSTLVIFMTELPEGVRRGTTLSSYMIEIVRERANDFEHFILVSTDLPNESKVSNLKYSIELFEYDFFALNPLKHSLASRYYILTDDEKENYYAESHYVSGEIPGISKYNPVVRYYGAKLKDVIRIERYQQLASIVMTQIVWREVRDVQIVFSSATALEAEGESDQLDNVEAEDDDYVPDTAEIQAEEETAAFLAPEE